MKKIEDDADYMAKEKVPRVRNERKNKSIILDRIVWGVFCVSYSFPIVLSLCTSGEV
jgi:hypothetical protein